MITEDITKMTGKELEAYLIEKVEKDWKKNLILQFDTGKNDPPLFTITADPMEFQTGNGVLTFHGEKYGKKWKTFKEENIIQNQQFPEKRKQYLENKLGGIHFPDLFDQANVLLSFEVARRKKGEKFPISRDDTVKAINAVMEIRDPEDYKRLVLQLLTVFGSGVTGDTQEKKDKRKEALENLKNDILISSLIQALRDVNPQNLTDSTKASIRQLKDDIDEDVLAADVNGINL